jgi:hypothetical protein
MHHPKPIAHVRRKLRVRQHHLSHTQNTVKRRPDFMTGRGQELGLGGQRLAQRAVRHREIVVRGADLIPAAADRNQPDRQQRDNDRDRRARRDEDIPLGPRLRALERDAALQFAGLELADPQLLISEIEPRRHQRGLRVGGELGACVVKALEGLEMDERCW